jgi:hypothetical protein
MRSSAVITTRRGPFCFHDKAFRLSLSRRTHCAVTLDRDELLDETGTSFTLAEKALGDVRRAAEWA